MKTRAILQTSPFKTRDGEWKAWAAVARDQMDWVYGRFDDPRTAPKPGDTITVERHGSEWRAL